MSLLLTDRQRTELNQAILEYLSSQGDKYASTITHFKQESGLADASQENTASKGILEKKWTSVIRLQKRIMELEAKVEQLQQQRNFGGPTDGTSNGSNGTNLSSVPENSKMLPKPPASCCLTGHRAPVTVVVTHPIYSIIASGSEDATIRLWDFETKQYER